MLILLYVLVRKSNFNFLKSLIFFHLFKFIFALPLNVLDLAKALNANFVNELLVQALTNLAKTVRILASSIVTATKFFAK